MDTLKSFQQMPIPLSSYNLLQTSFSRCAMNMTEFPQSRNAQDLGYLGGGIGARV